MTEQTEIERLTLANERLQNIITNKDEIIADLTASLNKIEGSGPAHNQFEYYIAFTFMVPGSRAISGGSRQFTLSAPMNSNKAINFVIHKIIAPQILSDLHLLDSSQLAIVITNVIPLGSSYVSPLLKP